MAEQHDQELCISLERHFDRMLEALEKTFNARLDAEKTARDDAARLLLARHQMSLAVMTVVLMLVEVFMRLVWK